MFDFVSFPVVGVFIAIAATFSAVHEIIDTNFEMPCYLKGLIKRAGAKPASVTSTNCCGAYQNVTVGGVAQRGYCNKPRLDFYGKWTDEKVTFD